MVKKSFSNLLHISTIMEKGERALYNNNNNNIPRK